MARPRILLHVAIAWCVAITGCAGATKVTSAGGAGDDASSSSLPAGGTEVAQTPPDDVTTTSELPPLACVGELSVEQKLGQLLMVLVSDPLDASEVLASGQAGGYALIGTQKEDVGSAIATAAAGADLPVFAAGDEEGGQVQRLRNVLGRIPAAREVGTSMTPEAAATGFGEYATKMAGLGLNMNLGPVADVGTGSGLGNRTYGDDVDTVTSFAAAVIGAEREAGIIPVVKHWPGIGSGDADPHQGASTVSDIESLRTLDLVVFDQLIAAGAPAIMVSHAAIPGLTDDVPASLSSAAITDELRGRQGFTGVVMTDSLGMGAVAARLGNPAAARTSIVAGADIALLSGVAFVPDAIAALQKAVDDGTLSSEQLDASVTRVLRLKGVEGPCPLPAGG